MALRGSRKGKGKATTRATIPRAVINWCLSSAQDHIQGFIAEHICSLIRIYTVCGVKDECAWFLFYYIIYLDPVRTCHISQFQTIWPHHWSRRSPFRKWWASFRSSLGLMYNQTRDQMHSLRWHNPHDFRNQFNRSNPQTTSLETVRCTGECYSWYSSDDIGEMIELRNCWQYKPGDVLAIGPSNRDDIIDEDDDDENLVDSGGPSGGRSHPADCNDNDNGEGEENTEGGEAGTGKGKRTKIGMGKGKGKGEG